MTTAKRLVALDGATITIDSGFLVLGGQGPLAAPCPVFLIEHSRGLVLFDTGVAPEAWDDPQAVYGDLLDVCRLELPPDNRLDRQLANHGFRPDDVTHVVVSHGHWDHTGGMHLFPHAQMYMSIEDIRYSFWPDPPYGAFFRNGADLERTRLFRWNPLSWDLDLFGDGSIQILRTPGHTDGELSILVKLPTRNFLLTADAVHVRSQIEQVSPCPVDMNAAASLRSIHRITQLAAAHEAAIWVMHDLGDWGRFGGTEGYS
jgi:glyoxylase-like metal-dependent hydrolase (beta-lactamase superfamily II)